MQHTPFFLVNASFNLCADRLNFCPIRALDRYLTLTSICDAQINLSEFKSICRTWRQPPKSVLPSHINCGDIALHPIRIFDILSVEIVFTYLPGVKGKFSCTKCSVVFDANLNFSFVIKSGIVPWVPGQFNRLVRDVELGVVGPLRTAEPFLRPVPVFKQAHNNSESQWHQH